ncbi:uncharacterized protein [Amphiura filiformis]|uniref:uncharacterized protein isoform X2 n=1 Tax=Amphiura filiformis TaxID=82378 RepID=UPI003B211035
MMNPTVILLALVAISITPVAAQANLNDGAIAGIVVGVIVFLVIVISLLFLCCWCVFVRPPILPATPYYDDYYGQRPYPLVTLGPPIIRPEPYPGAPCGPSFGAPRRIGYY